MQKKFKEQVDIILTRLNDDNNIEATLLRKKYTHIKYVFNQSIFELIPNPTLKNIQTWLANASIESQPISMLSSYANNILTALPLPINAKRNRQETDIEIELTKEKTQHIITEIEQAKSSLKEQINTLRQSNIELENRLKKIDERTNIEAARLDNLVAKEQELFSIKKNALEETNKLNFSQLEQEIENYKSEKNTVFKRFIDDAEGKLAKITELYDLASETSVSGFFVKLSQTEKKDANLYRYLAALFYCIIPISAIGLYFAGEQDTFTLESIAIKILVGTTFLVPAIYFSRESQKHRQQQFNAQKTGIRTQSFEPFISKLTNEDASELRKEMVQEWFTDKEKDTEKKEPIFGLSINKVTKLLTALNDLKPK